MNGLTLVQVDQALFDAQGKYLKETYETLKSRGEDPEGLSLYRNMAEAVLTGFRVTAMIEIKRVFDSAEAKA